MSDRPQGVGLADATISVQIRRSSTRRPTYAAYRALRAFDQRQESGHRYTVFEDSTVAIDRARADASGRRLGQCFAVAAMGVCPRALARGNEATIRWAPAHDGTAGNEETDEYARAAAEGRVSATAPPRRHP